MFQEGCIFQKVQRLECLWILLADKAKDLDREQILNGIHTHFIQKVQRSLQIFMHENDIIKLMVQQEYSGGQLIQAGPANRDQLGIFLLLSRREMKTETKIFKRISRINWMQNNQERRGQVTLYLWPTSWLLKCCGLKSAASALLGASDMHKASPHSRPP